jgi:hypothetical protein
MKNIWVDARQTFIIFSFFFNPALIDEHISGLVNYQIFYYSAINILKLRTWIRLII